MNLKLAADSSTELETTAFWRNVLMLVLTLVFVLLYIVALLGRLKSLPNEAIITRLEPIIFVIIGYYFGQLPAQRNEQTLKGELNRQSQKADAAQSAKEQAQQAREALEEKIKNVRVTLAPSATTGAAFSKFAHNANEPAAPVATESLQQKVANALSVLNS